VTDKDCTKCPDQGQNVGVSVVVTLLLTMALFLLYYAVLRTAPIDKRRHGGECTLYTLPRCAVSVPRLIAVVCIDSTTDEFDYSAEYVSGNKPAVVSNETRAAPTLTFQLKIIIGFLQIGMSRGGCELTLTRWITLCLLASWFNSLKAHNFCLSFVARSCCPCPAQPRPCRSLARCRGRRASSPP
jgi:hypothetical protein